MRILHQALGQYKQYDNALEITQNKKHRGQKGHAQGNEIAHEEDKVH